MWGGGGFAEFQPMSIQLYTWSPNKLWRSNSILTYGYALSSGKPSGTGHCFNFDLALTFFKDLIFIMTLTSTLTLPVRRRWETCVRSVSGTDGSGLYFLEGSLTNAVGAMYAKVRNPPF